MALPLAGEISTGAAGAAGTDQVTFAESLLPSAKMARSRPEIAILIG